MSDIWFPKERVKCANCGMVYDRYLSKDNMGITPAPEAICPKCGSNAYDPLPEQRTITTTSTEL